MYFDNLNVPQVEDILSTFLQTKSIPYKNQNSALVLIPCCKQKSIAPIKGSTSQPLPNIQPLRNQLLHFVQQTQKLANEPKNRRGILNSDAQSTQAIELYRGSFYQVTVNSLHGILAGQYPSVHVLIVSAFYGLAKLDETLKEYELEMGSPLHNGKKVYRYWQDNQLWKILQDYIIQNNITYVWSLLPDSMPRFPYHRVFKHLWRELRNTQIQCFHVKVPNAGSGSGYKRAEWLREILISNPNYLTGNPQPPKELRGVPGYEFRYEPC